jgi:hypothetical protein
MMKLLLNNNEIKDIATEKSTLGNILNTVQNDRVAQCEVISGIWVDGQALTAEQLSEWKDRPVSEFSETRIDAPHRNSLAAESLRLLAQNLGESNSERHQVVEHLHQGRSQEAVEILPDYLQIWDSIPQSLVIACNLIAVDIDSLEIYSPATGSSEQTSDPTDRLVDRIEALVAILAQLKESLESSDLVLLGDIIDYEFADMTHDWQCLLEELANRFDVPN